jgi:hypothetical protein
MTSQLLGSKLSREARAGFAPCSEGTVRKMQLSRQNVGLIPHPGRQELLPPECPPAALQWLQTRSSIRNPMLSQDIAEDAALELTTAKCHSPAGATMSWPDSSSASLAWPPRLQKRGAAPSIQARDFSSSLGTSSIWFVASVNWFDCAIRGSKEIHAARQIALDGEGCEPVGM